MARTKSHRTFHFEDEEGWRQLKQDALDVDTTMSAIIRRLIATYLAMPDEDRIDVAQRAKDDVT